MRTSSRFLVLATFFAIAGAVFQVPSAFGQAGAPGGAEEKKEVTIFNLKHASSASVVKLWSNLYQGEEFRGAKLISDERTNSVFVRAPRDQIDEITAILEAFDRPGAASQQAGNVPAGNVPAGNVPGDPNAVLGPLPGKGRDWQRQYAWPAANQSPEFQQYEQQARAAAQAYREQLAATPKDEKRLGELKAELQGAVHSAFHARQTAQRSQVAAMRKRLEEIESNISSRIQRADEIIQRRIEELLDPQRAWESPDDTQPSISKPHTDGPIAGTQRFNPIGWMTDIPTALTHAKKSRQPVLAYFQMSGSAPCRRMEDELLASPVIQRILSESFVTVVVDLNDAATAREYRVRAVPLCIVFSAAGPVLSRTEGLPVAAEFELMLKSAAAKSALDLTREGTAAEQAALTPTTIGFGLGFDPRKDLLIAENTVLTAKAALVEAQVEVEAVEADLARAETLYKAGNVPDKFIGDARVEAKRKVAMLYRARAELTGKERLLDLAKEQLASQIKLAEFELEHAKAQLELVLKEEARTKRLIESKSVSQAEYDKVLAETRAARANYDRAQARLDILHKALPGAKPADESASPRVPTTTTPGTPGKAQE
ncbi:MAG: thioredoxin family protein [Planctomycetia bacterium]|nr:thioredoxin family protein [Planctomycetia bacterium]